MLKRIEIKNFKSIKHVDFKCGGLNLLMGLNGAGKSSFVQVLELLRVASAHGLKVYDKEIDMGEIGESGNFSDLGYRYAQDDAVEVSLEYQWRKSFWSQGNIFSCSLRALERVGVHRPLTATISRFFDDAGHGRIMQVHPSYADAWLCSKQARDLAAFIREHGSYDELMSKTVYHEDPADWTDEDRAVMELQDRCWYLKKDLDDLKNSVASRVDQEEAEIREDLKEVWTHAQKIDAFRGKPEYVHEGGTISTGSRYWHRKFRFNAEGDDVIEFLDKRGNDFLLYENNPMRRCGVGPEPSRLIDEVNGWMGLVSPGARIEIERTRLGDREMLVEKVGFGDGEEKRCFSPQNVGFGISYTLPVVVALLTAQPEDVLIIENPEAHLHPKGQAQMGELIARAVASGAQVFVETHSDHVVNGVRSAVKAGVVKPSDVNIAFFERAEHAVPNEDGSVHPEIYTEVKNILVDGNGTLSEYPDGFMDEWNNQLMELI